jgi:polysaccharide biosynthesis protein PslG
MLSRFRWSKRGYYRHQTYTRGHPPYARWIVLGLTALCVGILSVPPGYFAAKQVSQYTINRPKSVGAILTALSTSAEAPGSSSHSNKPITPTPVAVPTELTRSGFGVAVSDTLQHMTDAQLQSALADMSAAGFTWIRFDLEWATVQQKGPSSYNWQPYDRIVAAANAKHFHLLPTLAFAPDWARQADCKGNYSCAPADMNQYAGFAKAAAARYSQQGIYAWEIWNEPNLNGFWFPAPSAASYTAMLKATYPAIKATEANSIVLTGGLGSLDDYPSSIEQVDFMKQLYGAGAKGFFDAVGYHPYSYPIIPTAVRDWSGWSKMGDLPASLRSVMVANGDGAKQLWLTEFGAPTNGPGLAAGVNGYDEDSHNAPDHVDEAMQAATASAAVGYVRAHSDYLGPLFWYGWKDRSTDTSTVENFFGLLRADGSKKPAYSTFQQLLR